MANHNLPTLAGTTYADFLNQIDARLDDLAQGLDPAVTTVSNPPLNAIRWTSAANRWEKWNGTAWVVLSTGYSINLAGPSTVTANSASAALTITQTGTGNALVVEDEAGDGTPLVVDAAGRLVVGALSAVPAAVQGSQQTPASQVSGLVIASSTSAVIRWGSAIGARGTMLLARSRGVSHGVHEALASGDHMGAVVFDGSNGLEFLTGAEMVAQADAAASTGSMPTRLVFNTTPAGSSTPVERLRIDSEGRVIGQAGVAQVPTVTTAASGSTTALTNATSHLLFNLGATAAAQTVTLPSAGLINGQMLTVATRSAITALTVNGGTVYGAPTTLAAGGFFSLIYSSTAAAWFRKG